MTQQALLVLNAGSSSLRFALYEAGQTPKKPQWHGHADLGARPSLRVTDAEGRVVHDASLDVHTPEAALDAVLGWIETNADVTLVGAGHRVVHGGRSYDGPIRVDAASLEALRGLEAFAPLHQPYNLRPIERLQELLPGLPQVACFDTAFHRSQPEHAQRFALPQRYSERGIVRYGFHGLSYHYIADALREQDPEAAQGRVVVAHLGNGASLCALREGRSIATTMGFTALDGLAMGQRCGSLDPGVVLYLLREDGLSLEEVERLLYRESGLLGMSGVSGDMRELLARDEPAVREALAVYVYRIQRELGSLVAALEGLDAIVFTGGIGEHAGPIREAVCAGFGWLGLDCDAAANTAGETLISRPGSRVRAWVIPTDEEIVIARQTYDLLA